MLYIVCGMIVIPPPPSDPPNSCMNNHNSCRLSLLSRALGIHARRTTRARLPQLPPPHRACNIRGLVNYGMTDGVFRCSSRAYACCRRRCMICMFFWSLAHTSRGDISFIFFIFLYPSCFSGTMFTYSQLYVVQNDLQMI